MSRSKTRASARKKTSKKASTAKKTAAKKKASTKAKPRRAAPKKTVAKKKAAAKKATPKKKTAKKAAAKKKTAKKAAAKKATARKSTAKKKAAAKKAAPKRAAAKSSAKKKTAAKKAAPKKSSAKKAAAKKAAPKKAATKSSAKKAATKKTATKKAATKKTATKKAATKKITAKKTTRKDATVVLAPRSSASVAPSIPLPVKKVKKRPTLEQRAKRIEERIQNQTTEFRRDYQENFEMSWIFHDTALEGVVYTYEELTTAFRSDEVTVVDSSVMPIYDAIRRHKAAIEFIQEQAEKKKSAVGVDLLKRIYVILHPEEGDAKSVKYRRDIPQHRLYFHEYAAPDKIAYRVRQVMDWINSPDTKRNVAPLRVAAKAHFDLARSYPFPHDSGKVARLFMNYLLLRAGMPAAIVHATERQRYYEALKSGNATMLVTMLRDSVENAVSSIEKLLDEHESNVRGFVS